MVQGSDPCSCSLPVLPPITYSRPPTHATLQLERAYCNRQAGQKQQVSAQQQGLPSKLSPNSTQGSCWLCQARQLWLRLQSARALTCMLVSSVQRPSRGSYASTELNLRVHSNA
jgi:hypothetical protein